MPFAFCLSSHQKNNDGGGENRTLVWQPSSKESTYLSASLEFLLAPGSRSGEEPGANYARRVSLSDSDLHQIASLQSRRSTSGTQAMPERTGSELGLTRLPLRVLYSQLWFCLQFTGYRLPGMHPSPRVSHRNQCTPTWFAFFSERLRVYVRDFKSARRSS